MELLKNYYQKFDSERALFPIWILLLTLITLYFQHSGVAGFFQDGYLYAAFGKHAAIFDRWLIPHLSDATYAKFEQHLPFLFMIEGLFFKIFGASYLTARLFGLLFLTLLAYFLWDFVKERHGFRMAFWSLLLFLIIPPLMKKSRFPNIDLPLALTIFLSLMFYLKAFENNSKKWWLLSGLFFGTSLLLKGPIAILIPFVIFVHLIATKNFKRLFSLNAWMALVLGVLLFLIWPFVLYLNGEFVTFKNYLGFTFGHTIVDGRGVPHDPFVYIVFFFKQTTVWMLLILFSLYRIIKGEERSTLLFLSHIAFWSMLVLLSCFRLKYSNYLIPLYPFMAIIAGDVVAKAKETIQRRIAFFYQHILIALTILLLVFPITTKSERDPSLHQMVDLLKSLQVKPKLIHATASSYPFFALANMMAFEYHADVVSLNQNDLLNQAKEASADLVILNLKDYRALAERERELLETHYRILIENRKENLMIFIKKKI